MSRSIEFIDVGRTKATWSAVLPKSAKSPEQIERFALKEVRARGGLMSRDIAAILGDDGLTGVIVVGLFRTVGGFRIAEDPTCTP